MSLSSAPGIRRGPAMRLFVMMVLEYLVWGAWLPLIWSYMPGLGFTPAQIALIGSLFAVASIAAIFFGNQFVDRSFAAERFMAGSHLVGGLAMTGLFFARSFPVFFVLMLVHAVCYVPTLSVANSLAFAHLKDARREFGLVRMGGSIGWILASWPLYFIVKGLSGAELQHGLSFIFIVAGVGSLALAAFSLALPHTPPRSGRSASSLAWLRALRLLVSTPFLLVLFVVTLLDSTIHNGYFLLAGGFLGQVGIKPEQIMPVMSLGQVSEIVTMAALGFFIRRLGWKRTMLIGIFGHGFRFAVFAFMSQNVAAIVLVQLLHGICYACFFATLYVFIDAAFPADVRTSAQGWFNLLVLGLGDLASKWLFIPLQTHFTHGTMIDYRSLFLVPVGLAIVAALLLVAGFNPPPALAGAPTPVSGTVPATADSGV